jgi:UDP-N-acetylglucosamine 4-epimerase
MDLFKDIPVLVTGGAGFIGSNLTGRLLEEGAIVTCLDNFATGHRYNIEPFLEHANYRLIEGDIRDVNTCNEACKNRLLFSIRLRWDLFRVQSMIRPPPMRSISVVR